ncbi:MAG: hypothetical protein AB7K24_03440 [Gemmataceae bacterium]
MVKRNQLSPADVEELDRIHFMSASAEEAAANLPHLPEGGHTVAQFG